MTTNPENINPHAPDEMTGKNFGMKGRYSGYPLHPMKTNEYMMGYNTAVF
jgi:hypothetical protein